MSTEIALQNVALRRAYIVERLVAGETDPVPWVAELRRLKAFEDCAKAWAEWREGDPIPKLELHFTAPTRTRNGHTLTQVHQYMATVGRPVRAAEIGDATGIRRPVVSMALSRSKEVRRVAPGLYELVTPR